MDGAEVAGHQLDVEPVKVWHTTGSNPRTSHARIDGEQAGLDDTFSNGLAWPHDSSGPADETAGCTCDMEIVIP